MQPKVSILIPCHNAEQWVGQAIESALEQTYAHKEIIVVDDGSTDNSLAVIQSFGDAICWETGPNKGGNIARNRLLALSEGEWLQYLDADDYLLPSKIEKQVGYLEQVPAVDVLYSPTIYEYYQQDSSRQELVPIPDPKDPYVLLARWFLPQTGSPLWRKQAIVDVGKWGENQPCCQEHELYLRLLMADKQFEYYSNTGSIYRQWSESTVCKRDQPEVFRQRLKIEDRLENHLKTCNSMTSERLFAINQARFECARKIWPQDAPWASRIVDQIRNSDKHFMPTGQAAPFSYQLTYKVLGFSLAERVAHLKRALSTKP